MNNKEIKLNDLLRIPKEDFKEYKLHLSNSNGETEPLDDFARGKWQEWNESRGKEINGEKQSTKNDFNRKFILGLIRNYHENETYLFGRIYEVIKRLDDWEDTGKGYEVKLTEKYQEFIGRLIVKLNTPPSKKRHVIRGRAFLLENWIEYFTVSEIIKEPYEGEPFPGIDKINIDFNNLKNIIEKEKGDWKNNLENIKGVYIIIDKSNGKKYIGSATSEEGMIWTRWTSYIQNGHGGNIQLQELIKKEGFEYAIKNFKFSILEPYTNRTEDNYILKRENFWKEVLLSRNMKFGYNGN